MKKIDLDDVKVKIDAIGYATRAKEIIDTIIDEFGANAKTGVEYGVINNKGELEVRIDVKKGNKERTYLIYTVEDFIINQNN